MNGWGVDRSEHMRLEQENEKLYEQVRTLSAELSDRHRADYRIIKGAESSGRPAYETAASRVLLTDEMVQLAWVDVFAHSAQRMRHQIEKLGADRKPVDHIWRMTLERDYRV